MRNFYALRWRVRYALRGCAATVVATLTLPASAQDFEEAGGAVRVMPEISVSASREGGALDTLSRNVTVISRKEILEQQATAGSLGDLLGKMVPGMAPSSQTLTNSAQKLRGRDVLVLIDGVPTQTNRNVSRDLFNISASNIESIEVVHGGSSTYGGGAAGGIIYINTLKGKAGAPVFETTFGASSSLTEFDDDALGGRIQQKLSGKAAGVDYLISALGEQTGGFFDAHGDRIPPEPSQGGLSDTGTIDLLGKVGYDFGDQRLQLMASYLRAEQDSDFISDPAVDAFPDGTVKARALKGLQLDDQTSRENLIVNLDYSKQNLFGSKVRSQVYYRNYQTRFFPFDARAFSGWGNNLAQSFLDSEVWGGRLTVDTPITPLDSLGARLLWGADVNREKTEQPVSIYDGAAFDASGGRRFVETDAKRTFVPLTTTGSVGVFGQAELTPTDWLILRGGVRHEWVDVSFDDFTTLGGNPIDGGSIDYSETTFNAGAVFMPSDAMELYANYSQSFELPDIGLQLRFAQPGFNVNDSNLSPRITDNYEVGVRGRWGGFHASVAAFYSESDKGRVTVQNFSLVQERTQEKIYGTEASLDYTFTPAAKLGGTFTWIKGEREDPNNPGSDIALNGTRIPPIKLTGFVEYSPYHWWGIRLQALYSGNRNDAFKDNPGAFATRKVHDYTVVDLYNRFAVGPGTLRLGIENLLNNQYYTVYGQLLRNGSNTSHVAARGAMLRASYTFKW
ncbi:TonB-dependent receptor [Nitrococcus mobilis]|uniref:TonB-dependent receptor n=1 Tax=Nitrococcus mobilis Nb-231 TaxID=314278 RepID=A4BPT3_9GAMM|nr:TonB-dependent receptor [Nitrococcus mobilis]EAR22088.1 hypothetical protein NB231_04245 [Nitrococcus mobilis Nb-231]